MLTLETRHWRPHTTQLQETLATLVGVLVLSIIGGLWKHIPPALSWQAVILLLAACLLLPSPQFTGTKFRAEWLWRSALASGMVYANFLFYFVRHFFSPRFLSPDNPLAHRAVTIALLTFIACQAAPLLSRQRQLGRRLQQRLAALLVGLLAIIYTPPLQRLFGTHGLTALDWLCTIIAALFYLAVYILGREQAKHSREAVLALGRDTDR